MIICRKSLSVLGLLSRSAMSYSTWRNYIVNLPQCNFKVTTKPLTATFNYPGFNHKCDRNGLTDIFNVMTYIVDTQYLPKLYPYKDGEERWFQWGELDKERYIFASSMELSTSQSLYNRQLPKWPLEAKCILRHVGKSTVSHQIESYIPGSTEPLVTYVVQMVTVDKVTRKSKPLPDWMIMKYKDQGSMKTGFHLKVFPRPKRTFVYRRQVMWLDTDKNSHSDYISYIRFALDGLHCAIKQEAEKEAAASKSNTHGLDSGVLSSNNDTYLSKLSPDEVPLPDSLPLPISATQSSSGGCLKGMTNDIIKRGIKSVKVCYVNECVEGDVVDVHIWQEDNEAKIVRCSVERESQIVCQLKLEYHDQLAKL